MKIFVTGAAGLIGRKTSCALRRRGWTVYGCDLPAHSEKLKNIVGCDLREALPDNFFNDYDVVVHLAGHPNAGTAPQDQIFKDNTAINENVFTSALASGVRKIVFASSVQVFNGWENNAPRFRPSSPCYLPLDGNLPANAANAYSRSKLIAEQRLQTICEQRAIDVVVLRFPWVFGSGKFFHATRRTVGAWTRAEAFSFLPVEDAASVIVASCERMTPGFRRYFPAAQENLLWLPAERVREEYFPTIPLRPGVDQSKSLVDLTALEHDLQWSPRRVATWKSAIVHTRNFLSRMRQRW